MLLSTMQTFVQHLDPKELVKSVENQKFLNELINYYDSG